MFLEAWGTVMADRRITIEITDDVAALGRTWCECESAWASPAYQRHAFVETWARHVAPTLGLEPRILVGRLGSEPVFILPLALKSGLVPLLVQLSDSHSNVNGGLFSPSLDPAFGNLAERALSLVPEAEGIELTCLPEAVAARYALRSTPHIHDAFAASLEGGMDGFLSRNSGRRKRKRHRRSERVFAEAGGWAVERARTPHDVRAFLEYTLDRMARRLASDGVDDPFAAPGVADFFREAAIRSLGDERPAFAMWRLTVAGQTLAVQGGGCGGDTFSLMFTTYEPNVFDTESPGEFLMHELYARAASAGMTTFDLGRGRERHKVSWTDGPVPLRDVRVGRTAKAKVLLKSREVISTTKRRIRDDDRLWKAVKAVRSRLARG